MENIVKILAGELGQSEEHVKNVIDLVDGGNTIPFIARYRKEMHGAMDDTVLRKLMDRLSYLRSLAARREEVKNSITAQGKLTEALSSEIDAAQTLAEVEDIYRPYKQKRRTRATIAKEKGLEPWRKRSSDSPGICRISENLPQNISMRKRASRAQTTCLPARRT